MNTCKIHAGYMQDTSGYVLYRKPPPICIGNPPSPPTCRGQTSAPIPRPSTAAPPSTHLNASSSCIALTFTPENQRYFEDYKSDEEKLKLFTCGERARTCRSPYLGRSEVPTQSDRPSQSHHTVGEFPPHCDGCVRHTVREPPHSVMEFPHTVRENPHSVRQNRPHCEGSRPHCERDPPTLWARSCPQ
jgi:hypothetical protein